MSVRSIAVTGSTGRIGTAICARASTLGMRVIGLDSLPKGNSVQVDIRNDKRLAELFEGVDCVIHCAGLHAPHVGRETDDAFRSINVDGTASVLRAAECAGVTRLVLTSSTALLGGGSSPGEPARWIDEMTEVSSRTIYHETKLEAEEMVRAATSPNFSASIVRLGRCFPEAPNLTAFYRLSRGISDADAATAHLCAAEACDLTSEPLIACAATPFRREDVDELGEDVRSVMEKRCPEVLNAFATRNWEIPVRVDRVYDSYVAQQLWRWSPKDGAVRAALTMSG